MRGDQRDFCPDVLISDEKNHRLLGIMPDVEKAPPTRSPWSRLMK
jgi:hypothetical protein